MKILNFKFIFACFAFVFILYAQDIDAATIGKPVSNLGLIGYWSFDEGSGTKAHDLSGRGNTGTLANSPTWTNGKRGKALNFASASTQYVSVGSNLLSDNDPFTIAAWVSPAELTSTWKTVFAESCSGPDIAINQASVMAGRNCGQGNGFNMSHPLTAAEANTWIFLSMTFDGANARLYKNGELVSGPVASTFAAGGHGGAHIGSYNGANELFNGKIDDVRLFGRALSASEILSLYRSGQSSHLAATKTGLVGHWSMNEGSGTIAHDQSGNGRNGTLYNMDTNTVWINGKKSKALDFDGSNDYVNIPWTQDLTTGTISVWMRTNSNFPGTAIFFEGNGTAVASSPSFEGGGTYLYFYVANGCRRDGTVTVGEWAHFVGTWDGANSILYKNGVPVHSAACASAETGFTQFNLGGRGSELPADISLDDARIYNRALSAAEVAALYRSMETTINQSQNNRLTDGLVGFWTFNGPDVTTTVADVSGQGNHGYFIGGATSTAKTIGKVGQALNFDGVDDYILVGSRSSLNLGAGSFTLCSWFKTSGTEEDIISNGVGGNGEYLLMSYNGKLRGHIWYSGNANSIDSDETVNDNKWRHGCQVVDASNIALYVDGSLDKTQALVGAKTGVNGTAVIGHRTPAGSPASFLGRIDEVRVYNRALTATEIKQLYNMGR